MKSSAKILIVAMMCALACSGCGNSSEPESQSSVSETTTTAAAATTAETGVAEAEETYMEKIGDIMAEMPPEEILTEREDIAYPKFEKFHYYSNTAERDTPVNVLLPVDYSEDKEYPVLYILHGYYDNEDWMTRDVVHISTMLANLIADGEAQEMIVVCPYIYCSKDMPYCTGMDTQNTLNYDNFINDMMTDLMPFIEENFAAAAGRENTAVTGFSMGGRESLFIGFSHPETFGYIGSVCTAPGLVSGTGEPHQLEVSEFCFTDITPYLLLLSAAENDGVVGSNPATYERMLARNGTEHLWHTMSHTGHDASSVTPHLYNFMRMIFRNN